MLQNNEQEVVRELLVLHADTDESFVQNEFAPLLAVTSDQVLFLGSLELGNPFISAIANAIHSSRVVIFILTPDFFLDPTCQYGQALAYFRSLERDVEIIPIIAKPCRLPAHLRMLKCLDISESESRHREICRLNRQLWPLRTNANSNNDKGLRPGGAEPTIPRRCKLRRKKRQARRAGQVVVLCGHRASSTSNKSRSTQGAQRNSIRLPNYIGPVALLGFLLLLTNRLVPLDGAPSPLEVGSLFNISSPAQR